MKIAIVISSLSIRGGTHKQVLRLAEYLEAKGEDVAIYTKRYDPQKTFPEFSRFKIVQSRKVEDKSQEVHSKSRIVSVLKSRLNAIMDDRELLNCIPNDVDIINMHDNNMLYLFPFLRKRFGTKVVWQINDLPVCFQEGAAKNLKQSRNSITQKADRILNRFVAKRTDQITVNVTKNKERVARCLNKPAKVFYCGVDNNPLLKEHVYPAEEKIIRLLSTGVFFPYRNYESLVLVVEQLTNKGYDVHLDIIGSTELDKSYASDIRRMINTKALEDRITVWGQVDETTYNELYNKSHIFLFMNIDQSWGLAVFEAMSCGLPTMVSNSVGAIELLNDDVDAIILDPKDIDAICSKIIRLTEDKEYYDKISFNGYEAVKTFTWERLYCEKMLNLFKELKNEK